MSDPVLRVSNYTKTYGDTLAVSDLSFAIRPGEILGMLGPNGAGKTTTIRAIAGVIPPTQGRLCVAGYDIEAQPIEAKRRLAYIPDDPNLFDALTVWEHLTFAARAYSVPDWEGRAAALLRALDLDDKKDTLARELSRGMRQKTAIACAYLHEPQLILFDEPLTGLDPRGIRTLKDSIKERAKAGAGLLVSSHLLELVDDLCTHLLIINKGQCLFFGALAEARAAFGDLHQDASLEDIFFRAVEGHATAGDAREAR